MKVLLTGANGFVGSHILDGLLAAGCDVAVMLRETSDTTFIRAQLPRVEIRYGSLGNRESLVAAADGVDAAVHCAGKTKAIRPAEYYAANADGTANLVAACNEHSERLRHLILISSLAATGPGTPEEPADEAAPACPVTHYGRSKLAGENHVRRSAAMPYTILRPAAVYGPRDSDFYLVFRSVQSGLAPLMDGGRQWLSLVFAPDVAAAVLKALTSQEATGRVYHVAHRTPCTQRALTHAVARAMDRHAAEVFVPSWVLYPICIANDLVARIKGKPSILNAAKIPEYSAPGWVCRTDRAETDLGFCAETDLDAGLRDTLHWYREEQWLPSPDH